MIQYVLEHFPSSQGLYCRKHHYESCLFQVLHSWFQNRSGVPIGYTIETFLHDVGSWYSGGYVSRDVWDHLKKHVNPELIEHKVKLLWPPLMIKFM